MASGHNENPQDDAPYRIPLASPDVGEEEVEAVREVLRSGTLTNGPVTRRFEERFAARHGVEHGVAFANGTAALAVLYLGLGIGPEDEVNVGVDDVHLLGDVGAARRRGGRLL